ncbi:MAG: hypothetical protein OHK0036_05440 [Bacteroidia bacterium]
MKNFISVLFCGLILNNYAQDFSCQKIKSSQNISSLYYSPENMRSDTFDVLHYDIHLEIQFSPNQIAGYTDVIIHPKMNNQASVRLDLLKLLIDSIKVDNSLTTYFYNDTLLSVVLPSPKNITDTFTVRVYYHGVPQMDPSGWGGFYYNGNYAFNLGVGFASLPHNFGRVWFPCFDNFVEKSTYDFFITTDSTKKAYCNGVLINENVSNGKRTRHWQLMQEIPSYLASVAVADYSEVHYNINSISGNIPAIIASRATDTNAVKTAFVHLPNAVNIFEAHYGNYVWPRIGYCMVPFSSGAMEHATNIAYPVAAIGTTAYESQLMAHELSHHWWGDLVTCETQEDMWINEGMATYSEMLFLENMYNYSQYQNQLYSMLGEMVQFGNFKEQQYWPVSGVPAQYTYGDHVYKKGAIVAHNLRTYLGDSLFFNGLKYVLSQKAFKNMNSVEFQTLLENYTGKNLSAFFQGWVLNGGYPVLVIDSAKYNNTGGSYVSQVYVRQKLHGAPQYFNQLPVNITYFDNNWNAYTYSTSISGSVSVVSHTLNFLPVFEMLNYDRKLAYASIGNKQIIKSTGNFSFPDAKTSINVINAGSDSSFIYIEHHFAEADPQKNLTGKRYKISNQHFWKVTGKLSNGFRAKLRLYYNGNIVYSGYGCMDTCLASINADSITVLYRPNAAADWREMSFTKYPSGSKAGMLFVDTLLLGEYTFANKNGTFTSIKEIIKNSSRELKVYPNPSQTNIHIQFPKNANHTVQVEIYNVNMQKVKSVNINPSESIDISDILQGQYWIILKLDSELYYAQFIKD